MINEKLFFRTTAFFLAGLFLLSNLSLYGETVPKSSAAEKDLLSPALQITSLRFREGFLAAANPIEWESIIKEKSFGDFSFIGNQASCAGKILYNENANADLPLLKEFFADPRRRIQLLKFAAYLRDLFPYNDEKNMPAGVEGRLKYALRQGYFRNLVENMYITPVSESFRRHIVFILDDERKITHAWQIKIPGRLVNKRYIDEKNFIIPSRINSIFPGTMIEPIFFSTVLDYGDTWDDRELLSFIAYEYRQDSRRLSNIGDIGLNQILDRYPHLYNGQMEKLQEDLMRQCAVLLARVHLAGYRAHYVMEGRGGVYNTTDAHIENIEIFMTPQGPKLIWCADTGGFFKLHASPFFSAGERSDDLDALLTFDANKDLRDLFPDMSPREFKNMYAQAYNAGLKKIKPIAPVKREILMSGTMNMQIEEAI